MCVFPYTSFPFYTLPFIALLAVTGETGLHCRHGEEAVYQTCGGARPAKGAADAIYTAHRKSSVCGLFQSLYNCLYSLKSAINLRFFLTSNIF